MGHPLRKYLYYILVFSLSCLIFLHATGPIQQGFQDTPSVSFITYGNDNFKQSRERIVQEAKDFGPFTGVIKAYTPDDLSNEFKDATKDVLSGGRGGGFWIWKPYIIHDAMNKLNANDILVYADAGCRLNKSALPRFQEYLSMISAESGKSIFAMRLSGFPEYQWTTSQTFDYLRIPPESDIRTSAQIIATVLIFRKTEKSVALVQEWLNVAIENPLLFSDTFNDEAKQNNPDFHDNRHDQSIFSLLVKSEYSPHATIIEQEIENSSATNVPILAHRMRV